MLQDLRYALRGLARSPGFAAAAILTLALGIGAVTAIFTLADAVLFRPLPYPDSNRLIMVWDQLRKLGIDRFPLNDQTFRQYSAQDIFESTAGFRLEEGNLLGGTETEHVVVLHATPALAPMLGVNPAIGRVFTSADKDTALLSCSLFRRQFAGDPSAVGRSIRVNDRSLKIIGVLRPDFDFAPDAEKPDLWVPLTPSVDGRWGAVSMLARLRPGVSIAAAQSSMDALARHLEETVHLYRGPHGEDAGYGVRIISLHDDWLGEFRSGTVILLAAVGAVLLIVLVNVANLMLVRAVSRGREFAVRRAVGVSEIQLLRQWMAESAVLATFGGVLGAFASAGAIRALIALSPAQLPPAAKIGMDAPALAVALAISLVVCLIFGIAPALAERRAHFWLRGDAPKRRTAPVLVMAEAALATALLIAGGLLLKSFESLSHVNTGFNGENLLTMQVNLPAYRYPQGRGALEFFTQARERLSALPGVLAASSSTRLPINGREILQGGNPFSIEGRPWNPNGAVPQTARYQTVDLDYFRTLQIPLVSGRIFNSADIASTPMVVVVNETLARGFFPNGALGQHILLGAPRPGTQWMTIIGIAGDVKAAALDEQTLPHIYMPLAQHSSLWMALVVRTRGDPLKIARQAAGIIRSVDPEQSPTDIATMRQRVAKSISRPRFETVIVVFFAAAALFLAAIGIFGVVAHSTARRTREIGIRMALGAGRHNVLRDVILGGLRPVAGGIALGIAGALALSRSLAALLFQVKPADPWIIILAAFLLTAVAVAACLIPARRAARIDPMAALRSD